MKGWGPVIKNIVCDMGNVLLRYDPQAPLDAFCSSEAEKELIRRELFEGPEWAQGDEGLIRDEDRFGLVRERVPEEHWPALEQCCRRWFLFMDPMPGAREFCAACKSRGYGLYILSNASNAFYWYFPDFLPLDYFDGIVVSADVRLLKPDRRIYEHLLACYGLKGEECLFLDDLLPNVEGARAAGLNAFHFQGDFQRVKREYKL